MPNLPELLFDTTALIDIYRGRAEIQTYFEAVLSGELVPYVSVITEAELWRGLRVEELGRHQMLMEQFICLPLDSEAARQAGTWMQKHSSAGLGWMDAFIAATAKIAGLSVLTRDKRLADLLSSELKFELYA